MVTGKFGLMVRVMGTSQEQPLTVQAQFICGEVIKMNPKSYTTTVHAHEAIRQSQELEFVQNMAFQIRDHQTALAEMKSHKESNSQESDVEKFRFSEALDAWILEVDEQIKLSKS